MCFGTECVTGQPGQGFPEEGERTQLASRTRTSRHGSVWGCTERRWRCFLGSVRVHVLEQKAMGSSSSTPFQGIPGGRGPYTVGCTDLMSDHTVQGCFLRLFYPCRDCDDGAQTQWIPRKEYYLGLADTLKMNRSFVNHVFNYYFGSVTCPAKWDAPFKAGEKYPLIVFSHGLGAFRTLYSAICIEIASHGFVIAAVEHRDESASATYYFQEKPPSKSSEQTPETYEEVWMYYRTLKAGEQEFPLRYQQVLQRGDECVIALNLILDINAGKPVTNTLDLNFNWSTLQGSIDTDRIASLGHSFGGATVIQCLAKDARFRCGIALDAWMFPLGEEVYSAVHQPLFFINSERFQWTKNVLQMKKLDSTRLDRRMITIKGAVHQSFPDFTFLTGTLVGKIFKLKGSIDPYVAIEIINKATLAFLQKHLCLQKDFNQWDALLDGVGEHLIPGTNINLPSTDTDAEEQ
ncbi:platelet-activating factor acetylhydrolase isoform X2 [Ambystoma mexicanum]|uniref:platelet-activating factor acetylhydrolase isoform X2 n=1 Tax=Ambystoma mexicanum TaxID=8296 RepID=UPI0037E95754